MRASKYIQMISYNTNRSEITKKILEIINPEYGDSDLRSAIITWWINIRPNGGLGLTETGHTAFERAQLEQYTFEVDIPLPTIYVIAMRCDRAISCPYYLRYIQRQRYISVYDSRIAMMIQLHGSFSSYLNYLENSDD